ncbi:hypothetical protein EGM51_13655 [Verrucomicrobia bacterium S94]|nr:hypothetical protein EGM51_13655 [Verrucomicrobia bacterium S94]
MQLQFHRLCLGTLAVSLACSAAGAGLGELKRDTEKKAAESRPQKQKVYSNDVHSAFGSGTYPSASSASGSGFMSDFWGWLIAAPFKYRSNDPNARMNAEGKEGWATEGTIYRPMHESGDVIEPYARVDLNYQYIDSANQAFDGRLELGYKALAFYARTTAYQEDDADPLDQTINQYYGALRYGFRWPNLFPGSAEIALGLGVAQQHGDLSDDHSVAVTLPIKYYPTDWLGFEFRPAWYEADYSGYVFDIGDYDISASVGYKYVHLRVGYRLLYFSNSENGHYNNGPYTGLTINY